MRQRFVATLLIGAMLPLMLVLDARSQTSTSPITSRASVNVGLVEVKASPGTTAGDSATLTNNTSDSITLTAFTNDVGVDSDGGVIAVPRGSFSSDQPSASQWVTVTPQTISLPPKGTATVNIRVSIPKGTSPHGYYSAITFDTNASSTPEARLVHALLIDVSTGKGSGAVPRLNSIAMPALSLNGKLSISVIVQNVGTVHAIGSGTLEIKNFGVNVTTLNLPPIVVLPNVTRLVRVSLPNPPIAGRLTATATINFANGVESGTASGFVVIWWFAAMLALVLVLFTAAMLRLVGATGPKAKARRAARQPVIEAEPEKPPREEPKPAPPRAPAPPPPPPPPPPIVEPAPAPQMEPVAATSVMSPDSDTPFWDEHGPELAPFAKVEHDDASEPAIPIVVDLDGSESDEFATRASQTREQAAREEEEELTSSWATPPPRPARPIPVRPVPVKPARKDDIQVQPIELPPEEELRPAGAPRLNIRVANLPPVPNAQPLPESPWASPPPETTLERPKAGGAMALRRAEVAVRMITGKTGETGAILDAGLDLLYSVRSDRTVVEHLENEFTSTRNRRRLGPLALALFAVDSLIAPEALLDAYASATKVVADRIRRAILACDPADIRRHRDLINALPPARRDSIGL